MIEAAGTSKQIKRKDLTLADKILVLDELKNKTLKQTMSMKSSADATAVTPPKNKEVLHALAIIRRWLQFEGADMDTFLRLERQMQDSMQNKIKQTTIAEYFA